MTVPKRRGLALTIIGPILMLVLAPVALGIGIWRGVATADTGLDHYSWVDSGQTAQLNGVGTQAIVVSDDGDSSPVHCSVHGPSGQVNVYFVSYDDSSIGAGSYLEVAEFDADAAGAYQVDCAADRVKVMPTQVLKDADRTFGVRLFAGFAAAGVLFAIGVALLIIGIVKLVNSGRERQRAGWAQPGYYPYPAGGPAPYNQQAPGLHHPGGGPQPGPPRGDPNDPYAAP